MFTRVFTGLTGPDPQGGGVPPLFSGRIIAVQPPLTRLVVVRIHPREPSCSDFRFQAVLFLRSATPNSAFENAPVTQNIETAASNRRVGGETPAGSAIYAALAQPAEASRS